MELRTRPVPQSRSRSSRARPGDRESRRGAAVLAVGLVALTLLLAGCRLDVDARIEVASTGSGVLALDLTMDAELLEHLTATGFDPAPEPVPGWEVARAAVDGGGERITVATTFDDPGQLSARVAELGAGLDDEDPALVESVDLRLADDGSTTLAATVALRLPSSTGVAGPGLADAADLAARAADPAAFGATFTVVLPGEVTEHNADIVAGSRATWELAAGEVVEARVAAAPPDPLGNWVIPAAGTAVLVVLVLLGVHLLRRRRREHDVAPHGRVERLRRWGR